MVSDDGKAMVAAILTIGRMMTGGSKSADPSRKAYIDEFLRTLHTLKTGEELKDDHSPDPL
jgi:hypothetical protein